MSSAPPRPSPDLPIGIFDSGIGGLTVLRAVARALPHEHLLYLGDTARVPYGTKTPGTVARYAGQIVDALLYRGVKMVVVACNTATAHAMDAVRKRCALHGMCAVGVIGPGVDAALAAGKGGGVMVLATESTVLSGAYQRALRTAAPDLEVEARPAPLLVGLAEAGWVKGDVPRLVAERYLAYLPQRTRVLLLGCTHYPLLKETLQNVVGPGVVVVDSAEATARAVKTELDRSGLARAPDGPAVVRCLVTDGPGRFQRLAPLFSGLPLAAPELVDL